MMGKPIRHPTIVLPVASTCLYMCKISCCGNTIRASDTKGILETVFLAWRKYQGMVKSHFWMSFFTENEIGNPHANFLRTLWKVYGNASETAEKSVGDDGQSTQSLLKGQSAPRSRDWETVIATNLQHNFISYLVVCKHIRNLNLSNHMIL
jgi:hypothetical protein